MEDYKPSGLKKIFKGILAKNKNRANVVENDGLQVNDTLGCSNCKCKDDSCHCHCKCKCNSCHCGEHSCKCKHSDGSHCCNCQCHCKCASSNNDTQKTEEEIK